MNRRKNYIQFAFLQRVSTEMKLVSNLHTDTNRRLDALG